MLSSPEVLGFFLPSHPLPVRFLFPDLLYGSHHQMASTCLLVALIGGVEMRIATYKIAICFHLLLLSLLTVGRFRVSFLRQMINVPGLIS